MAIESPTFLFAAPPKSGCRWVHGALKETGHVQHGSLHTLPDRRTKPLLSVVRDPADWARSWFQNINCAVGVPAVDAFLLHSRGEREPDISGFRDFINNYIAAGLSVGAMFRTYHPDRVFRIEDAPEALQRILGRPVQFTEPGATRGPLIVPADVRELIYSHESDFCHEWDYPC